MVRSIKRRWSGGILCCEGARERGDSGRLKPSATTSQAGTSMVREMDGRSKGEVAVAWVPLAPTTSGSTYKTGSS